MPELERTSPDHLSRRILEAKKAVAALTPRQREVLRGILRGDSARRIARDLAISPRTVEAHRRALLQRLGVRTTAQAVRIGICAELESGDDPAPGE